MNAVLVHLAAGIGDIVLATPLLATLARSFSEVDVRVDGDYPETADLLRGWGALRHVSTGGMAGLAGFRAVLPAIPPFYWPRYAALYRGVCNAVARPPDTVFYADEQSWYLAFASALGIAADPAGPPFCTLPITPEYHYGIGTHTLVLAPGCKGGEMAAKRWPFFVELAAMFEDVAVVGTAGDLTGADGRQRAFPPHVRNLAGRLTLRQTAAALAACGAVVANDSGLGHIAASVGVPTVLLFGPTSSASLGRFPPNVMVRGSDLACAPCWFAARLAACAGRIDCLRAIAANEIAAHLRAIGFANGPHIPDSWWKTAYHCHYGPQARSADFMPRLRTQSSRLYSDPPRAPPEARQRGFWLFWKKDSFRRCAMCHSVRGLT